MASRYTGRAAAARRALLLLLTLCFVLPAWARPLADATAWPQEQSDLKPDPAVTWGRLDNGMRYVLMPNDTPKGRVSLRLVVAAGSLMETEDQRGLAHFLEHMAFKGSQNLPAGDLVQYLERLGMAFGADTNARTSFENTTYQLELPSNDPALVDKSLSVLRETADRLLILEPEVDHERGVVLSEKRLRDTPDYRAYIDSIGFLLPDTLVSQRFPIGSEAVIEHAPRGRLVDFYRTWYRPDRLTLIVVGAIDPAEVAQKIQEQFGSLQATAPAKPNPELGSILPRQAAARLHSDPDAQTRVTLETAAYVDAAPDTRASRTDDAALYLANAVLSRRLATLAAKGDANFINGGAQTSDLLRFIRIGLISLQTKPEQWKAALGTAEQELRRALTYGFTVAELDEQKKSLLAYFEQQAKSASTRESPDLANDLAEHLNSFNVFTHPDADLAEFRSILPDVTPQQAQNALRKVWSAGAPLAFVTGPITLAQPENEILAVLEQSRAQAVTPPKDGDVAQFAYTEFGVPSAVTESNVEPLLGVTQIRFANNVRLNLKRTDHEANTILVNIRFGGGRLEVPRDKPGVKLLADQAFVGGGLQKHSLDELNRIVTGRNIGLDFSVDDDAFVFAGRTTPADLQLQLQLVAAYLTAPGYRPEALERFRQGLGPLYLNLTRTPGGVLQSRVSRALRSGDTRFGYPDQAEVAQLTLDDLRAWLSDALARGYLEISLVGDFDPAAALQAVASTFGSLPTREASKPPYAEERKIAFPRDRALQTFTFQSRDPKSYAAVYWPTTDFTHLSEVRQLFVLAKVLEGRMLARIRVQQGLSYTAQGGHSPTIAFPGFGLLFGVVDAPPDKAEMLALELRDIAAGIVREGVTQDELERARNPIVNELKKLLNDNNYLTTAIISGSQEQPDRLKRATTSVAELNALTTQDLDNIAKKYLQPEAGLPVVVVPNQTTSSSPTSPTTQDRHGAME